MPVSMKELNVVGVRLELPAQQPIVLLKEVDGVRYLPIAIGSVEATAIAFAQQGVVTPRPMTHDLMRDVLQALGAALDRVEIAEVKDGVFYASLVFADGTTVSSRSSDAIALAMRMAVPVFGSEEVMAEAGVDVPEEQPTQESEMERFREFLDGISPEDFES